MKHYKRVQSQNAIAQCANDKIGRMMKSVYLVNLTKFSIEEDKENAIMQKVFAPCKLLG